MGALGECAGDGLLVVVWFAPPTHALLIPARLSRPPVASPIPDAHTPPALRYTLGYGAAFAYPNLRTPPAHGAPVIHARAAFLFDPVSGTLFYQKNANAVYPAAGLTKIMTLLLALDTPDLDQPSLLAPMPPRWSIARIAPCA